MGSRWYIWLLLQKQNWWAPWMEYQIKLHKIDLQAQLQTTRGLHNTLWRLSTCHVLIIIIVHHLPFYFGREPLIFFLFWARPPQQFEWQSSALVSGTDGWVSGPQTTRAASNPKLLTRSAAFDSSTKKQKTTEMGAIETRRQEYKLHVSVLVLSL